MNIDKTFAVVYTGKFNEIKNIDKLVKIVLLNVV